MQVFISIYLSSIKNYLINLIYELMIYIKSLTLEFRFITERVNILFIN